MKHITILEGPQVGDRVRFVDSPWAVGTLMTISEQWSKVRLDQVGDPTRPKNERSNVANNMYGRYDELELVKEEMDAI